MPDSVEMPAPVNATTRSASQEAGELQGRMGRSSDDSGHDPTCR